MRHKEEIKLAVNDFGLLNEASVDVGTLRWVVDEVLPVVSWRLLEESLANALVHDDESDLGEGLSGLLFFAAVLHSADAVQLLELLVDDLLTHGIADTITVDEDVAGHGTFVEVSVGLERACEVIRQNCRRDDFLSLDRLRTSLSVVLAHGSVVGRTEADGRLLALMTDINTDEHGLVRDLGSERHTPEITAKFGVHLSDDIQEDTIIVLGNSAVGDKLGNDGTVTVDLVLQERIEVLMVRVVGHDDKEDEVRVLNGTI